MPPFRHRSLVYLSAMDKVDLFNAMMERVVLTLEDAFRHMPHHPDLSGVAKTVLNALELAKIDERTRRVLEVATLKVEYVAA